MLQIDPNLTKTCTFFECGTFVFLCMHDGVRVMNLTVICTCICDGRGSRHRFCDQTTNLNILLSVLSKKFVGLMTSTAIKEGIL